MTLQYDYIELCSVDKALREYQIQQWTTVEDLEIHIPMHFIYVPSHPYVLPCNLEFSVLNIMLFMQAHVTLKETCDKFVAVTRSELVNWN